MSEITRVGVDLAKSVIQVNAVDAGGKLVTNRQLSRDKFLPGQGGDAIFVASDVGKAEDGQARQSSLLESPGHWGVVGFRCNESACVNILDPSIMVQAVPTWQDL